MVRHGGRCCQNCPRYIPKMQLVEPSIYAPRAGVDPPEPVWKSFPVFKDAVHPRQKTFSGRNKEATKQTAK